MNHLSNQLYSYISELERQKYRELNAVTKLQKNVKMFLCYRRFKLLQEVALEIQRNFKGYMARSKYSDNINGLSNDMNMEYFEYHACIVQK